MEWLQFAREFGLPSLLLLIFVGITHKMIIRVVVPWVKALVDSHIAFVDSMHRSSQESNKGHQRIWESIDKLTESIREVGRDVREVRDQTKSKKKDEAA